MSDFTHDHITCSEIPNNRATLYNIAQWWNVLGMGSLKPKVLVEKLLPDILNADIVIESDLIKLTATDISKLIYGNYRNKYEENGDSSIAARNKMMSLGFAIRDNRTITYQNNGGVMRCRDNMLHKIRYFVTVSELSKLQKMYTELYLLRFSPSNRYEQEKLENAIKTLCVCGTIDACTYAIFLLILSSILRDNIAEINDLYKTEVIDNIIKHSSHNKSIVPTSHELLIDKKYINRQYRIYMFRPSMWDKEHLYNEGTLSLNTITTLRLNDVYEYEHAPKRKDPIKHHYTGTPIKANGIVYILMHDKYCKDSPGILAFNYCDFDNGEPLYFRLGIFISVDSGNLQVQRAVITEENFRMDNITEAAIRGLLRTSGRHIFLAHEELEKFKTQFANERWMDVFIKVFEKQIKESEFKQYIIDENKILEYLSDTLSSEELVQIAYSLKNHSDSRWPGKDTHIDCTPPEHFHRLIR